MIQTNEIISLKISSVKNVDPSIPLVRHLLSCTNKNSSRSQRLPSTELYLVCSMDDNVIFIVSFRNELVPLYPARRHHSATRTGPYLPFLGVRGGGGGG